MKNKTHKEKRAIERKETQAKKMQNQKGIFNFAKASLLFGFFAFLGMGLFAFTQANNNQKKEVSEYQTDISLTAEPFVKSKKDAQKFLQMPLHYYKNPYDFLDLWLEEPLPISVYSEDAVEWQKKLNKTNYVNFVLTHSPQRDEEVYTNDNHNKFVTDKEIDNEEITPFTWKWVEIVLETEDGNRLRANLRRPNWWLKYNNADKVGNKVVLSMPEMGISGTGKVTTLTPNMVDTRLQKFERDKENNTYRPITGKFERDFAEVWDFYFDNNEKIGATKNHPFYSEDRNDYIPIGKVKLGEAIRTKGGTTARFLTKKKRPKKEKVYNLEIWRDHNFHVGESGLLVHNSCPEWLTKEFIDEICEATSGTHEEEKRELYFSAFNHLFVDFRTKHLYKYRLIREHITESSAIYNRLDDHFYQMVLREIDEYIPGTTLLTRDLGTWFEAQMSIKIGEAFDKKTGLFDPDLPDVITEELMKIRREGYTIMATQIITDISKYFPEKNMPRPDMLFFKANSDGSPNFDDVLYYDIKLDAISFEGAQKNLAGKKGSGDKIKLLIQNFKSKIYGIPSDYDVNSLHNLEITLNDAKIIRSSFDDSFNLSIKIK